MIFTVYPKLLLNGVDPTAGPIDVPLGQNETCSRHQITVSIDAGAGATGLIKIRGKGWKSALPPASFDSRLDAINMATLGSQSFVFYGLFDGLRFDFSTFGAGHKVYAHLVSHESPLKISGNTP